MVQKSQCIILLTVELFDKVLPFNYAAIVEMYIKSNLSICNWLPKMCVVPLMKRFAVQFGLLTL